ncbi:lysoplasmalogenase [Rhinatrema bivittatum]|uniref:lysoplasmalogenase n=1 Tax=Rhinatrema bivittatum TaxID=194408 RepID=UPI00112ADA2E|nr:lysoplasmalogenase [Rhinatrema bivittatum]
MDLFEPKPRSKKKSLASVRSLTLCLLPFIVTSAAYFALWPPPTEPSCFQALLKCLPVLSLAFFVVAHSHGRLVPYTWKILLALLLSAAGDVCLLWTDLFLHGMALFGLAHLLYILAFGLRPLHLHFFLPLAMLGGAFYAFLLPYLQGPLVYATGAYTALISGLTWRALTRARRTPYGRSWAHISSAVGAIIFMVSDSTLAVDRFCFLLPHAHLIVMVTYYLAQLLIALSVTQPSPSDELWKVE